MILEVDNIELRYSEKLILQAVYLKTETSKITGILGRNGSGKSSLLQIIFGNISPKYKLIRIDHQPIIKKLYKTGLVTYLPQHHFLPKHLSLHKIFNLYEVKWDNFTNHFEPLSKHKNAKTKDLSGGEQRIVEIYLILKSKVKITLLDEPFSNIAPIYIEKIKGLIEQEKQHKIIMLTDHLYEDVLDLADNIYLLKNRRSILISDKKGLEEYGYLTP
ncbi:ATP-binding cassette domain-containing protein [Mesonia sp. K7]|uniref:ATP-binding cassette domain-containing protein n=1 Tax=Mesonia sp. K7 TaxID=2218606 RepID=UPI000DA7EF2E|nr:ATP-binding cassette domain-containing protein [Mesonia sp. K7]PZD79643.1 ABC transporter ATP-binding protein [Mesonia sp. K7]